MKTVYTMENTKTSNIYKSSTPKGFKVELRDGIIKLNTKLDLDYWEVDSDWDGEIFRSVKQAKRPIRSGEIPMELEIKTGGNICIRLVTVKGVAYQLHV
jgi:hypothetical protein